jgi:S-adenosylmethionine:tRNA ribosyltransferase-isomerase
MRSLMAAGLDFELAPSLEAHEPPEARGLTRDSVRMLVTYRSDDHIVHAHFRDLPLFLAAGDLIVVNTSGTLNAALQANLEKLYTFISLFPGINQEKKVPSG